MRRSLLCIAVLTVFGVAAASASADGPTRVPESFPQPIFRPAGKVCAFPVEINYVIDRAEDLIFPTDANGDTRVIITGHIVVEIINRATGTSLDFNTSGPAFATVHPDGSVDFILDGRTEIDLFPTDIPAGPDVILNSGRLFLSTGHQFVVTDQTGRLQDVCALLS